MAQPKQTTENALIISNQPSRADEMLITTVFIALLLLIGVAGLLWSGWNRLAFAPTPTPTATPANTVTSTPDRRATQIAFQLATQTVEAQQTLEAGATALQIALLTTAPLVTQENTPSADSNATLSPSPTGPITPTTSLVTTVVTTGTNLIPPSNILTSTETSTVTVNLPAFPVPEPQTDNPDNRNTDSLDGTPTTNVGITVTQTADAITVAADNNAGNGNSGDGNSADGNNDANAIATNEPISSTIFMPAVPNPVPTTPVAAAPTATNIAVIATPLPSTEDGGGSGDSPGQSETPTPPAPTDTPTPLPPTATPLPTPTAFVQQQLKGIVNVDKAKLRRDPDGAVIPGELPINREVELTSRVTTGEWISVCCLDNQVGWIRQAQLTIRDNTLDDGAPDDADPDDVRWLRVDTNASPQLPQVAAVPAGTYPLRRGNSANHGFMTELPTAPVAPVWESKQGRASDAIISPITLSDRGLFVSTQDGHIYSFDKVTGNERWRYKYSDDSAKLIRHSINPVGNQLYTIDGTGTVYRIEDRDTSAGEIWKVDLKLNDQRLAPATDITIHESCLYIGTRSGDAHYLVSVRQSDGNLCFTAKMIDGISMQYPALGGQLIFVGTDKGVFAKDVKSGDDVWKVTENLTTISASPVYSYPGVDTLAELYVAREGGDVIALDANTGEELWRTNVGQTVTGMALSQDFLYVSGSNFVKILSRSEHTESASINVNGDVPSGPLVSSSTLLSVTEFGDMIFSDASTLAQLDSRTTGSALTISYVSSGPYLYTHDSGTAVRAFRTQQ